MKILIVSQYFWPENFRINDLATELAGRGHEITVLTGWPNYPEGKIYEDFNKYPQKYANFNGVTVVRVPLAPRGQSALRLMINYFSFIFSASLLGSLKLAGKKYDLIFVCGLSPITVAIPAIFLKFIKKTPIALWVLDLWPESLSAVGVVKSKKILDAVGVLVRFIYKNCDLVLAQSKSFISSIGKYCSESEKIKYFPSWSEDLFNNESVVSAPEVEAKKDIFNILFSGNIGDAQDFPTILNAAEYLRERSDIRWIIVGDGRMAGWVREQIVKRNLQNNVVMTGRFPLERMPSFFAHADALLVSLKANDIFAMTIPGKVQTYLSSGLPIIGAIDGEGAEVIREAGAGYACKASDAEGLAAVVAKMAALNVEKRDSMGKAGKAYYVAQFEKKFLIDKLESYFHSMSLNKNSA
ncbi:glycosyltransferase family 4 protein [Collimonas sp. OK307]|uniref:glycosyltransferase family 4 protein n=1 Tax=Collimonas sp. OK307 TaxID=1801620 RepID=UPI000AC643BE|nr:glycosyltransferase family 4 protein [Collimonas sp. OK307]